MLSLGVRHSKSHLLYIESSASHRLSLFSSLADPTRISRTGNQAAAFALGENYQNLPFSAAMQVNGAAAAAARTRLFNPY